MDREKKHKCATCGKAFSDSSLLERHIRTHTGERPYKCDECGAAFTQLAHLTGHQRLHSGEKPYKCDLCGQAFAQLAHLIGHQRTHTGEKPFACQLCEHRTTRGTHLRSHYRTVHKLSNDEIPPIKKSEDPNVPAAPKQQQPVVIQKQPFKQRNVPARAAKKKNTAYDDSTSSEDEPEDSDQCLSGKDSDSDRENQPSTSRARGRRRAPVRRQRRLNAQQRHEQAAWQNRQVLLNSLHDPNFDEDVYSPNFGLNVPVPARQPLPPIDVFLPGCRAAYEQGQQALAQQQQSSQAASTADFSSDSSDDESRLVIDESAEKPEPTMELVTPVVKPVERKLPYSDPFSDDYPLVSAEELLADARQGNVRWLEPIAVESVAPVRTAHGPFLPEELRQYDTEEELRYFDHLLEAKRAREAREAEEPAVEQARAEASSSLADVWLSALRCADADFENPRQQYPTTTTVTASASPDDQPATDDAPKEPVTITLFQL